MHIYIYKLNTVQSSEFIIKKNLNEASKWIFGCDEFSFH